MQSLLKPSLFVQIIRYDLCRPNFIGTIFFPTSAFDVLQPSTLGFSDFLYEKLSGIFALGLLPTSVLSSVHSLLPPYRLFLSRFMQLPCAFSPHLCRSSGLCCTANDANPHDMSPLSPQGSQPSRTCHRCWKSKRSRAFPKSSPNSTRPDFPKHFRILIRMKGKEWVL